MSTETLLVTLEGLLVFGGVMVFGLWQLHSVKKDQEQARRQVADKAQQMKHPEQS